MFCIALRLPLTMIVKVETANAVLPLLSWYDGPSLIKKGDTDHAKEGTAHENEGRKPHIVK